MARALVVPLPVRVQRVQLHAPPRVRHLEELALRTPARFDGVKFQFGGSGRGRVRIEGDEAGPDRRRTSPPPAARARSPPPSATDPSHLGAIESHDLMNSVNKHNFNPRRRKIMLLLAFTIIIGLFYIGKSGSYQC